MECDNIWWTGLGHIGMEWIATWKYSCDKKGLNGSEFDVFIQNLIGGDEYDWYSLEQNLWNVTIIYGTLKDILEWNPMEQASMKKGWKDTTGYYVSWRKMEGHSVSKRNVFDVEWWYGTGWDGSARHSEITKIRGC